MRNIVSPLDGIRSPFGRRLGAAPFTPASLFAASEPGGWYDPSDLTTLFQDAAGTTPVTAVEQPVGLVLDKSRGLVLGSELVTNGTFDSNTTGWSSSGTFTSTAAVVDGTLQVTATAAYGLQLQAITCVSGRTYKVTGRARRGTINAAIFASASSTGASNVGISQTISSTSFVDVTIFFTASATTMYICLGGIDASASGTSFYDNISVRELPGSHLSQSTSTARPVLSARVNLLTYTEDFAAAPWKVFGGGSKISSTAIRVTTAGTGSNVYQEFTNAETSASSYVFSVEVMRNASSDQTFQLLSNIRGTEQSSGNLVATDTWQRFTITGTYSSGTTPSVFGIIGNTSGTQADLLVRKADLRPANAGVGLPAYQRVGAATSGTSSAAGNSDYDTTGFPLYLKFDGTDDVLAAPDSSGLRQSTMSFWAGVNPLALGSREDWFANGDANAFSTNNWIFGNGTSQINLFPRTPASIQSLGAVSANTAFVVYAGYDGSSVSPRLNATAGTSISATLGTDNTSGFFLGSSKTSGYFSYYSAMHLYSLIIRGAATDAATITSTETWVNGKTRAF